MPPRRPFPRADVRGRRLLGWIGYIVHMGAPAKRRATYEDLLAVRGGLIAELIHGVVVTQPRPAAPHARAATRLSTKLGSPFDLGDGGPGGWVILYEPELHLHGGHVLVPDLAGWRREHMPQLPMTAAAFELTPDWVCEVLSPGTGAIDRADKVPTCTRLHSVLADIQRRLTSIPRSNGGNRTAHSSDAVVTRTALPFCSEKTCTKWSVGSMIQTNGTPAAR